MVRMIICLCRGLNTAKVNDAIAAGARSPAQVHAHHQTRINCGKCSETVCSMIRDKSAADGAVEPMLAAAE
jgi:bacterioferritin-associated ferredoxin